MLPLVVKRSVRLLARYLLIAKGKIVIGEWNNPEGMTGGTVTDWKRLRKHDKCSTVFWVRSQNIKRLLVEKLVES